MEMSHMTVKLETMTAESKQQALELETMRQKYEAWMKRAEDLTNENELLKRELERREVEETLRRKKEKEMEEKEMEKSDTSIVGDAKPVNTAKREPEIEERLLRKQEEAQKEPNPAKSDGDATGTTLEEQTGENMEIRRKDLYQDDDEKADRIPERRSSCDNEQEEKAHGRRRRSHRDSESGQKASDKRKGPYHEDESREKTAQRILKRWKGRNNANVDTPSRLDSPPYSVPVTEGGIILQGEECGKVVSN